ncbi:MAG TPA: hypothetical protein VFB27_06170 [Opitutaceae bacterium]|nr:hypothetical protein [Opitutaceae bacterium]
MKITRLFPAFAAGLLSLGLAVFAATRTQAKAPAAFVADALVPINPVVQPTGMADYAQADTVVKPSVTVVINQ